MLPNGPDPLSPEAVKQEVAVIPMNFRKDYVPRKGAPGEFKEVHRVDLVKKGSNGESTPWAISHLKEDRILWPAIKPFYEAWLEGQDDPTEGTPIDALPFIPPSLVPYLRNLHIRSAEDLAQATEADLERIGMGARMWREKARLYVEAKSGDAKLADALAERDAQLEHQATEIDELRAQVNELLKQSDVPKRRGRPPKSPPPDVAQ